MIVCVMAANMILAAPPGRRAIDEDDESLMKDVLRFTSGEIDYRKAGELYKLAEKVDEEPLKQLLYKASAIALVYSGKRSIYEQNVRKRIDGSDGFEHELNSECDACHGTGTLDSKCPVCHGSGRCAVSSCRGGRIVIRRIDGDRIGTCGSCNGTGQCNRCHGKGVLKTQCQRCGGKGIAPSKKRMEEMFEEYVTDASTYFKRKRDREAEAERLEAERRQAERERREREELAERMRKEREAFEAEQRAKGLVQYDGEWMTPSEKAHREHDARFARLIASKSRTRQTFKVLQVLEEGRALCVSIRFDMYGNRILTDEIFCLLYTASINRTVVDGEIYTNDLYWSGTYSYTTVQGAPKKVALFAIELADAIREARRQGYDE